MDRITQTIYQAMSYRLRAIEKYATKAESIQAEQLNRLIGRFNRTRYGEQFALPECASYTEWQRQVPIVAYEDIRKHVEEMTRGQENELVPGSCLRFAVSSGTSGGRSKYIPVNSLHLNKCHFRGASDTLWLYLSTRPDSRFFRTKGLVLGGSQKPVALTSKVRVGDLSSILVEKMPLLGNLSRVPKRSTLQMTEWNSKIEAIIHEVKDANVGSLSGVPSWMLVLIKRLLEATGKETLSEIWPNLEVFFHGGISFAPYREEYRRLIPSNRMQYRETYNASEGFFGIQDDPSDPALLLMLDYGVFYEFIPLDSLDKGNLEAIPLQAVETGKTYAMLISTLGGLYRYMIGDTVRFTSTNPYKIIIAGRTSAYINAFGEELMVFNTDKAIEVVAKECGALVKEYTAAPCFLPQQGKGRHEWVVEFSVQPDNLAYFAQRLDEELRKLNSDYDAKRYDDMTLLPLKLHVADTGLFERYLSDTSRLGGQIKIPRLRNDRTIVDKLLSYGCTTEISPNKIAQGEIPPLRD